MPHPRARVAAFAVGCVGALALVGALEAQARWEERFLVYPWDTGRRFATRPGVGGTNSLGFHERELPTERAPGQRRIVVVGDSMTWGTGPAEEAWPALLERSLGAPWQVINLSHYGYDTAQAAAVLRDFGWSYGPDRVVYAAYTNDPLPSRLIHVAGGSVWVGDDGALPPLLHRTSALLRRLEGAWLAPTVDETPDWRFYEAALSGMAADAAAHEVPLVVFGLVPHVLADPNMDACDTRAGKVGRCAEHLAIATDQARIAKAQGLRLIHVLPLLQASGRRAFFPMDASDWQHPSTEGHAVFAEAIEAELRGASLLDPPGAGPDAGPG